MKLYPVIQALLLLGTTSVYGQINLSAMDTLSTDSLQKSEIRYFSPGKGGVNRVWDFSQKLGSKASSQVMFAKDSAGVISIIEPGRNRYYRTTADTLILIGSESPLEKRVYSKVKLSKRFPLEYGDSITGMYKCEGMYCGNHPFREIGTRTIKVDAVGSIVLAENDTVGNVKRVHTIDSYSVCMDIDSAALDTAKLTQVIEERYEWFLSDSQYPIIENITSTTYFNMDAIGTTKYAWCNLPDDKVARYINPSDDDTPDEPDNSFDVEPAAPDIIHYNVDSSGGVVTITYDLDADASIGTIVASHMGMVYSHREWTQKAGQGYSVQIDCNGLRSGMYILYINVNGKAYSEKVIL
ncbi:hypothetical protein SAMN04488494_0317 [Xylanibacter ruminicola]|uniref:Uncharacterized protein n=1 Tax=Xylanibacter ruminicola TaxID=839 RepID=A0A1M7P2Y6_XYLRU|nr:hypothetical protein SAMN04488493_1283 [Xylanibacter ruminicola]SHN10909.1 hypothetical protein SAMN04488494_0317 [Xylanibacter ruminicola]